MGCCHGCMRGNNNGGSEYEPLKSDGQIKSYNTSNNSIAGATSPITPRISQSLTRDNTFLLQVGLIGDIEIYEKRCWLLRLLDEDEFEVEENTKKEVLRNKQISQCNKNFIITDKTYCAQIQLINDIMLEDDESENENEPTNIMDLHKISKDGFDINKYNALILCYDITNLHSFNKLREYLDKLVSENQQQHTLQVAVMGLMPSCDTNINGEDLDRRVKKETALQLCKEYDLSNVSFIGESNAKNGENVLDSVRTVVKQCIETQDAE